MLSAIDGRAEIEVDVSTMSSDIVTIVASAARSVALVPVTIPPEVVRGST